METSYDWDRLREPSPGELARMDLSAASAETSYLRMRYAAELRMLVGSARVEFGILRAADIRKHPLGVSRRGADGGCPAPEDLRAIHKAPPTSRPQDWFIGLCYEAVKRAFEKAEAGAPQDAPQRPLRFNPYEVLSAMLSAIATDRWEAQRAREAAERRKRAEGKPSGPTAAERKVARQERLERAIDTASHGASHGEFYLPGIAMKDPHVPHAARPRKRHKRRKPIPAEEQLGSIIRQTDREEFRLAFGHYP